MTETQQRGPLAGAVDRWRQSLEDLQMGPDGLFQVELHCLRCGKLLNADGNHPAEVHAGTANGLCYGCTKAGPYVAKVAVLDGCQKVSWPPHCPSWRRDRESFWAYPGCEVCKGLGVGGRGTGIGGNDYRTQCQPCLDRYANHQLRLMDQRYMEVLREAGDRVYRRQLLAALGAPKRCSQKKARELLANVSKELRAEVARPILERFGRLEAQHLRRVARLRIRDWVPAPPEMNAA